MSLTRFLAGMATVPLLASACDYKAIHVGGDFRGSGTVLLPSGNTREVVMHTSFLAEAYDRCISASEPDSSSDGLLITLEALPIINETQTVSTCCVHVTKPSSGTYTLSWLGFPSTDATVINCNDQSTCTGLSGSGWTNATITVTGFNPAADIDPPVGPALGAILGIVGGLFAFGIILLLLGHFFCKNRGVPYDPNPDIASALSKAMAKQKRAAATAEASSASADHHPDNANSAEGDEAARKPVLSLSSVSNKRVHPDPEKGQE